MHQIHDINEDAWQEWREYRETEKRKKIGKMAEKKQRNFLAQYPPPIQQAIIDASIMNSWQGLFPPKGQQMQPATSTRTQSLHESLSDRSWAK